jgi:hypothetical protein
MMITPNSRLIVNLTFICCSTSEYHSACHALYPLASPVFLKYSGSKEIEYEWFSTRLELIWVASSLNGKTARQSDDNLLI